MEIKAIKNKLYLVPALFLAYVYIIPKYWRETLRILGWGGENGGIDLALFYYRWTHEWFNGVNIYTYNGFGDGYPPASIVMLYPLTGWLDLGPTRFLWAFTTILCFAFIVYVAVRATNAHGLMQILAVTTLFLLNNGVGVTYGNGQATLLVMATLLPAILLLHRRPISWHTDTLAAVLFTMALLKPNLTAPYIWLLLIFPNTLRLRPLALVGTFYLALSLLAAQFVNTPLPLLFQQFLTNRLSTADASLDPNVHFLLGRLGLENLMLPTSALLWLILGVWLYRNRRRDFWLKLAVTTLVMRLWSYHWIYDNAFLLIPEIALICTLQRATSPKERWLSSVIFIANVLAALAPGNLGGRPEIVQYLVLGAQAAIWLATLAYFLLQAKVSQRLISKELENNQTIKTKTIFRNFFKPNQV